MRATLSKARFPSQPFALEYLRASARAHALHPRVRGAALQIVRAAPFQRDERERARALLRWTHDNITFVPDPYRAELFQAPHVTLELGAGDCDDHASLLGAMMTSVGIRTRLVASGFGGRLTHVFPGVFLGGRWVAADSTLPSADLELLPPHDTFLPSVEV